MTAAGQFFASEHQMTQIHNGGLPSARSWCSSSRKRTRAKHENQPDPDTRAERRGTQRRACARSSTPQAREEAQNRSGGSVGTARICHAEAVDSSETCPNLPAVRTMEVGVGVTALLRERQDALPLDFMGGTIDLHEIMSYERLLRARETVDPI